jgi:hypothetical protein
MRLFVLIVSIIMVMGFTSCGNAEKLIEKEKIEIYQQIETILAELEYNDYSIHINYHKNFNNRERSKSVSTVKIFGDELPINIINDTLNPDSNMDLKVDNQVNIQNGYVETRSMVVNYDEINSGKIFYEYVSIVVIIGNIEQKGINQLLKLFNNYILNNNRGDTIYIMSK